MKVQIPFDIDPQPDDITCGQTCLHAVYQYYSDQLPLPQVISEIPMLEGGGTLAVLLACHALKRGYSAAIFTYNLQVFDPTWFQSGHEIDIREKLQEQARFKSTPKLQVATQAYLEFLELGGRLRFQDLTPKLLRKYLNRSIPVLAGLSSTYLYRSARVHGPDDEYDDIRGEPGGHFVVLCGYDRNNHTVMIADPYNPNPVSETHLYEVDIHRVIGAILLGILTYDGNLLIIDKKK